MATKKSLDMVIGASSDKLKKDLDEAKRKTRKWSKDTKKDFSTTTSGMQRMSKLGTKAFAALGVSAAAAFAAIGQGMLTAMNTSKELQKLSRIAGQSTTDFQRMAYAAGKVGVEQDKLADIIRDVNDKMGDVRQTGGGALADFYEQIIPKVKMTGQEFAKLSGKDALQAYVSALEEANVSQSDMIFYMEALASDSSELVPLFVKNGQAMTSLGDRASELGIILSEDLIADAAAMESIWADLVLNMQGMFTTFAANVLRGFNAIFKVTNEAKLKHAQINRDDLIDEYNAKSDQMEQLWEGGQLSRMNRGTMTKERMLAEFPDSPYSILHKEAEALKETLNGVNDELVDLGKLIELEDQIRNPEWQGRGDISGNVNVNINKATGGGSGRNNKRTPKDENEKVTSAFINSLKTSFADVLKGDMGWKDFLEQQLDNFTSRIVDEVASGFMDGLLDAFGLSEKGMEGFFEGFGDFGKDLGSKLGESVKGGFDKTDVKSSTSGFFSNLQEAFSTGMEKAGDWISQAFSWILGLFGGGSGTVGIGSAATGGIVGQGTSPKPFKSLNIPGVHKDDQYPFLLAKGEMVVPASETAALMSGKGSLGAGGQTFNFNMIDVRDDVTKVIYEMMPKIAAMTNSLNRENGLI